MSTSIQSSFVFFRLSKQRMPVVSIDANPDHSALCGECSGGCGTQVRNEHAQKKRSRLSFSENISVLLRQGFSLETYLCDCENLHVHCCTISSGFVSELATRKDLMLEIRTVSQPRGKNPVPVLRSCHCTAVVVQLSVHNNNFLLHCVFYSLNIKSDFHSHSLQNSKITASILFSFFLSQFTVQPDVSHYVNESHVVLGFDYSVKSPTVSSPTVLEKLTLSRL